MQQRDLLAGPNTAMQPTMAAAPNRILIVLDWRKSPASLSPVSKAPRTKRAPPTKSVATADRILEAALEEFALLGFDGARMTSIAERAGINHPLIHHYFGSKEALWQTAVQHAFAPLAGAHQEALLELRDAKPLDVIRIMTRRFILFSARNPHVGMIVSHESMIGGPRLAWLAKSMLKPVYEGIGTMLDVAMKNGDIKPLPKANVIQALIGAIVQFYSAGPLMKALYGIDPLSPHCVQEHADVIMDIVFSGIMVRSP